MGIKSFNPYTPSRRHMTSSDFNEITKSTPEKSLVVSLKKNADKTRNAEEITAIVSELSQFSSKMASDIQYQYENS